MAIASSLLLTILVSATAAGPLPRGNEQFWLGMTRAQVDSVVADRKLAVISDGTAYLVCASDDSLVEYVQYSFFLPPHGTEFVWKVTLGYRLESSRKDLARVIGGLQELLGPPSGDSDTDASPDSQGLLPAERQVVWADASTSVRAGGRWGSEPDRNADRMLVTWTDRRIQRMLEAKHKKDKAAASQ